MDEQFLSYWLLWIIFMLITFFMNQTKKRQYLMSWLLFVIICIPYEVPLDHIQLSVAFIVVFIGSIVFYAYESISIYKFFVTFTVMVCYLSLLLWKKIMPIWFFMSPYFMITVVVGFLISIFFKSLYQQITVALIALGMGHLVFQFILISYRLQEGISGNEFLIQICFIVLFQITFYFIQVIIQLISRFFEQKFI